MKKHSIIYVNYSPYENAGHILEYLTSKFNLVYVFSISHHSLGSRKAQNKLTRYENGKVTKEEFLYYMRVPDSLIVLFLPFRSITNAFQIYIETLKIYREVGKVDIFFTPNAFTASVGNLLKKMNLVGKTIFWVWDYYPPKSHSISANIMRYLYWQFDKYATLASDKVFYVNKKLVDIRIQKGLKIKNLNSNIIPIGTDDKQSIKTRKTLSLKLIFLGVIKKSQGVLMVHESESLLNKHFGKIQVHFIGSGPEEKLFKDKVSTSKRIRYHFHGYVSEDKMEKLLSGGTIGIALYSNEDGNMSQYADPSKLKRYIENGLPVITTNETSFAYDIKRYKAGIVIEYGNIAAFVKAIKTILNQYDKYSKGAYHLRSRFNYKKIYASMFH